MKEAQARFDRVEAERASKSTCVSARNNSHSQGGCRPGCRSRRNPENPPSGNEQSRRLLGQHRQQEHTPTPLLAEPALDGDTPATGKDLLYSIWDDRKKEHDHLRHGLNVYTAEDTSRAICPSIRRWCGCARGRIVIRDNKKITRRGGQGVRQKAPGRHAVHAGTS